MSFEIFSNRKKQTKDVESVSTCRKEKVFFVKPTKKRLKLFKEVSYLRYKRKKKRKEAREEDFFPFPLAFFSFLFSSFIFSR